MNILISGIIIFFGIHLLPGLVKFRHKLITKLGETPYQGLFAVIALTGLILIIYGKSESAFQPIYEPATWATHVAAVLMALSFIFLASANLKSNIKRFTAHPMLWGVTFWSCAHLLANGDLASLLLFASFGVYSLYDMHSANKRGASRQQTRYPLTKDIITIVAGLAGFGIFIFLHGYLFGVPAI
ncbi:MAG: NnrU family protein [Gammaproteobacteria bacterium]